MLYKLESIERHIAQTFCLKTRRHMSHVMRKLVFAICEQQRRRSAACLRSLISTFVVCCLNSIIPQPAIVQISRLASLSSWAGWFEPNLFSWWGSYYINHIWLKLSHERCLLAFWRKTTLTNCCLPVSWFLDSVQTECTKLSRFMWK